MVPNLSSILYEFTNREKDRIEHCFRIGNFNSLRDLPKHLLPGNVSYMSTQKSAQFTVTISIKGFRDGTMENTHVYHFLKSIKNHWFYCIFVRYQPK